MRSVFWFLTILSFFIVTNAHAKEFKRGQIAEIGIACTTKRVAVILVKMSKGESFDKLAAHGKCFTITPAEPMIVIGKVATVKDGVGGRLIDIYKLTTMTGRVMFSFAVAPGEAI